MGGEAVRIELGDPVQSLGAAEPGGDLLLAECGSPLMPEGTLHLDLVARPESKLQFLELLRGLSA